jgi:hypothetical protein
MSFISKIYLISAAASACGLWSLRLGHGRPMAGPHAADALQELAVNFDRVARPNNEQRAA